jgi:glutamate 5-kinase
MSLTLVIKIGTQALTTTSGALDRAMLASLSKQVSALKDQGHFVVLVSSGAVGAGRQLLGGKTLPDPVTTKQVAASLGQAQLIQTWQAECAPYGLTAAQVLLTRQDFQTRSHYLNIQRLFDAYRVLPKILPIVNENDSVAIQELMFTDNDELASLVAMQLQADRVMILSSVPGVYDGDPSQPDAKIIPVLDPDGKRGMAIPSVSQSKTATGRGGMVSKLASSRKLARVGITTHIADAREDNVLARLLADERLGTTILAARKAGPIKRYLASGQGKLSGAITANACLAEQLRDPDRILSILPIGLTAIDGAFEKGDLVAVHDEQGERLAVGVAKYGDKVLRGYLGQPRMPVFLHYDSLLREG